ncbi:MAG TPA: PLP-dependent aspartate aminotransferase family protein [Verrucomicrobium sp.]|nr:PLP-dependent aspartate aminotransferase family protein [Verrucomicrobium sp.]
MSSSTPSSSSDHATPESSPTPSPQQQFETAAIHRGNDWRDETGAVIPPVYLTSTFEYGNPGGFDYTRSGNPNFRNLQQTLAALEGCAHACVFASGVSAITAVVSTLKSGDVVVLEENVYGCTYRLFARVFEKFGVKACYFDLSDPANYSKITELKPALVWIESPTNPMLKVLDIAAISEVAKAVGAPVLVDNTFASSYVQQPIKLGATLSLLSTTKYSNGHSDALGGAVCTDDAEWQEKMIFAQKALGLQPSPFDAWLTSRGIKTEAIRMERHSSNALTFAERLENRAGIRWVRYPFLPSHPQYELAKRQMRGGSGIITADLGLDLEQTMAFMKRSRYFTKAESLGGIESLICHPASMTHASIPREVRESVGITDGVVRFSVGIEHIEDLWTDVASALEG